MSTYSVIVGFDCNVSIDVEADSPEEARDQAQGKAEASLCHNCSSRLNLGDQTYVLVEEGDRIVLEEGGQEEAEERGRAAAVAWLRKEANRLDALGTVEGAVKDKNGQGDSWQRANALHNAAEAIAAGAETALPPETLARIASLVEA